MRILKTVTIISTFLFFSFSCESTKVNEQVSIENNESETTKDVSAVDFKELITKGTIVLDVRRPVEYNAGHLENAININYFDGDFVQRITKLDKSKTLLIYCASGGRSSGAMNKLKGQGFSTMYNMLGGISAWKKSGFALVN